MTLREAESADLGAVLGLYAQLHPNEPEPSPSESLSALWERILADPGRHIIVVERERVVAACCDLLIVPNLTRFQRPWAIIENVVTDVYSRRKGCGEAALEYAIRLAQRENCYKLMLASSRKNQAAHALYRKMGFSSEEKDAFVMRFE